MDDDGPIMAYNRCFASGLVTAAGIIPPRYVRILYGADDVHRKYAYARRAAFYVPEYRGQQR